MSKHKFLAQLRKGLSGLPQDDIEEGLTFYSEIMDDQMEEGLSEEEAVAAVGSVDEIVAQIIADTPLTKIVKERIQSKRRRNVGKIVLLVLGSPIWISLGIAAIAVILSLYISSWAVFVAFAACFIGGIPACVFFAVGGNNALSLATLAASIVCAGVSIFMFYGCKAATNGIIILTKKTAKWIKSCFIKKEVVG